MQIKIYHVCTQFKDFLVNILLKTKKKKNLFLKFFTWCMQSLFK